MSAARASSNRIVRILLILARPLRLCVPQACLAGPRAAGVVVCDFLAVATVNAR
jgi:hypothetical protein